MSKIVKTRPFAFLFTQAVWALALPFTPSLASAHDSWLIADRSTANDGDVVWLSFVTGEVFPLGEKATEASRVAQFVDRVGDKTVSVTGYKPQDKGLSVRRPIAGAGLHVIGCALSPNPIEMTPKKFEEYLRSERAESALASFQKSRLHAATAAETVVEEYTKFAKTMIEVSPAEEEDDGFSTPLGHRLEIVPLTNPCGWKAGQKVKVKVLFDGYPWPDVNVAAGHEDRKADDYASQTRTDAKGIASIELTRPAHWFLNAHVIRPTDGLGKVKWESFWASLTFRATGQTSVNRNLQSIRALHGRLDPGAVAGYRIGQRALAELGLASGSSDLLAIHRAALNSQFAAMLDGIQAATGATLGRLNLRMVESDTKPVETIFSNKSTGHSVVIRLSKAGLGMVSLPDGKESEARALKLATMRDDELFDVMPGRDELRMANSE